MSTSHLDLAVSMAQLLERLGIRYVIGGSVASSMVGEPRSTVDVDIAVELGADDLARLIESVRPEFYVPEADAARAVRDQDSFNIIHNHEALKIDLFILGRNTLDSNQIERRRLVEVPTDPPASLWIASVEDRQEPGDR